MVWVMVRVTGLVLAVLVVGHFALTHIVTDVADTGADFVAHRLGSALFVAWDAVMLVFAVAHGAIGVGVIIVEYASGRLRRSLHTALAALSGAMIVGGLAVLVVAS
jgi:succinate dehydrogenase hydrophobic anchor subunit